MCDLAGESSSTDHYQARRNQQPADCCMCGDFGITEELFRCRICHFRLQHKYCSELYPKSESYENCNWCLRMINIHQKTDQEEKEEYGDYKPKSSIARTIFRNVSGTIKKRSNSLLWNSLNSSQQAARPVKKKKKKQLVGGNSSPDADREHRPIVNSRSVPEKAGTISKSSTTTARRHQSVKCNDDDQEEPFGRRTKSEDDLSARLLSSTGKAMISNGDDNTAGRRNGNGTIIISRQNSYRNSMGRCKVRRYKLLEEVST